MNLLSNGITYGQAVTLVLLCVFLLVFIIADIYLVLYLRRKNKMLVKRTDTADVADSESTDKEEITENK